MAKSASAYVASNDFEGAKARFDSANGRWRKHWFDACYQIAQKVKDWATKYIFDPIALTIEAITQRAKKIAPKQPSESHVYLIKMFDNCGKYVFLKAGKANDLRERLGNLSKHKYKRSDTQIANIEILKTWTLPSNHLAESFEQALHHYLSSLFVNIPNDRYDPVELTDEQMCEIDRRYELMTALF